MRQPDKEEGDKANDAYIYFPGGEGYGRREGAAVKLTHYEKFVSRGKGEFTYGGALDLHNPKASSWMRADFPAAGEYTLKLRGRSKHFQLDKIVLSTIDEKELEATSRPLTEFHNCD